MRTRVVLEYSNCCKRRVKQRTRNHSEVVFRRDNILREQCYAEKSNGYETRTNFAICIIKN